VGGDPAQVRGGNQGCEPWRDRPLNREARPEAGWGQVGSDLREMPGGRGGGRAAPDRVSPKPLPDLVDREVEGGIHLRLQGKLELRLVAEVGHRDPEEG